MCTYKSISGETIQNVFVQCHSELIKPLLTVSSYTHYNLRFHSPKKYPVLPFSDDKTNAHLCQKLPKYIH